MSKTRWIPLLIVFALLICLGSTKETTRDGISQPQLLAKQQRTPDFCCLAGLSCCVIPPTK